MIPQTTGSVPVSRIAARRVAAATGCVAVLTLTVWTFAAGTGGQAWGGDYTDVRGLASWLIASISEPQFYAMSAAGSSMVAGGLVAYLAQRSSRRLAGFKQACGTGIWPPVAGAGLASLVLGTLAWGWTLQPGVWQPLFVPLVAVAPAMVVLYGPALRVCVTAAVSGAVLTPPASILTVDYICKPWHLPLVVGATTGMWAGALVAFWLCRFLPWMPQPGAWRAAHEVDAPAAPGGPRMSVLWVLRRALADFSEAQFYGNEWASAAMLVGAVIAYVISPSALVYGSGLFLAVLASQILTALAGVLIWRRQWQARGFYPTFVPVVSVAPATVLALGGTLQAIVAGALAGALIAPPLAAMISRRLPHDFHPFIGNVASMTICSAVIVPLLDLVPGIAS